MSPEGTELRIALIKEICKSPEDDRTVAQVVEIAYNGNPLEDGIYWGRCDEVGQVRLDSLVGPFIYISEAEENCRAVLLSDRLNEVVLERLLVAVAGGQSSTDTE
jgi:hypothetical protein